MYKFKLYKVLTRLSPYWFANEKKPPAPLLVCQQKKAAGAHQRRRLVGM